MEVFMSELSSKKAGFLGTYFDRDAVLRLVQLTNIISWIVALVYGAQLALSILVFLLSYVRGFLAFPGLTDLAQQVLYLVEQPFRGLVYFIVLQVVGKVLLLLLDIEDNTRRAARSD
jgi:hypothetical protein